MTFRGRLLRAALFQTALPAIIVAQMVQVPMGTYVIGDDHGEQDERPSHRVTLGSFEVDAYEVTYAQYDSCVRKGGCPPAHYDDGKCFVWTSTGFQRVTVPPHLRGPDIPVVCVTWSQAARYCAFRGKRLPTEAQWERAARADTRSAYAWGDEAPDAGRCTQASEQMPRRPGKCAPNGWGIYDMTGNVWEWTADLYDRDYYASGDTAAPRGPDVGRYRVIRGGGWYSATAQLRVSNRHWFDPYSAEVSIGFRCVR